VGEGPFLHLKRYLIWLLNIHQMVMRVLFDVVYVLKQLPVGHAVLLFLDHIIYPIWHLLFFPTAITLSDSVLQAVATFRFRSSRYGVSWLGSGLLTLLFLHILVGTPFKLICCHFDTTYTLKYINVLFCQVLIFSLLLKIIILPD
jgi:hypothetical protein